MNHLYKHTPTSSLAGGYYSDGGGSNSGHSRSSASTFNTRESIKHRERRQREKPQEEPQFVFNIEEYKNAAFANSRSYRKFLSSSASLNDGNSVGSGSTGGGGNSLEGAYTIGGFRSSWPDIQGGGDDTNGEVKDDGAGGSPWEKNNGGSGGVSSSRPSRHKSANAADDMMRKGSRSSGREKSSSRSRSLEKRDRDSERRERSKQAQGFYGSGPNSLNSSRENSLERMSSKQRPTASPGAGGSRDNSLERMKKPPARNGSDGSMPSVGGLGINIGSGTVSGDLYHSEHKEEKNDNPYHNINDDSKIGGTSKDLVMNGGVGGGMNPSQLVTQVNQAFTTNTANMASPDDMILPSTTKDNGGAIGGGGGGVGFMDGGDVVGPTIDNNVDVKSSASSSRRQHEKKNSHDAGGDSGSHSKSTHSSSKGDGSSSNKDFQFNMDEFKSAAFVNSRSYRNYVSSTASLEGSDGGGSATDSGSLGGGYNPKRKLRREDTDDDGAQSVASRDSRSRKTPPDNDDRDGNEKPRKSPKSSKRKHKHKHRDRDRDGRHREHRSHRDRKHRHRDRERRRSSKDRHDRGDNNKGEDVVDSDSYVKKNSAGYFEPIFDTSERYDSDSRSTGGGSIGASTLSSKGTAERDKWGSSGAAAAAGGGGKNDDMRSLSSMGSARSDNRHNRYVGGIGGRSVASEGFNGGAKSVESLGMGGVSTGGGDSTGGRKRHTNGSISGSGAFLPMGNHHTDGSDTSNGGSGPRRDPPKNLVEYLTQLAGDKSIHVLLGILVFITTGLVIILLAATGNRGGGDRDDQPLVGGPTAGGMPPTYAPTRAPVSQILPPPTTNLRTNAPVVGGNVLTTPAPAPVGTPPPTKGASSPVPVVPFDGCIDPEALGEKQSLYRGTVAKTESGLECQRWNDQFPHAHYSTPEAHPDAGLSGNNYCRNPGNEADRAWCFTTDSTVRWEYCQLPTCDVCGSSDMDLSDYRGALNTTKSGNACQDWVPFYTFVAQQYPDSGLDGNYCRNPYGQNGTWCFSLGLIEPCDVPTCESLI